MRVGRRETYKTLFGGILEVVSLHFLRVFKCERREVCCKGSVGCVVQFFEKRPSYQDFVVGFNLESL